MSSVMKTPTSLRIHSNAASTRLSWRATTRKLSSRLLKREDCFLTRNKMSRRSIFFRAVLKTRRRYWSIRTTKSSLQPTSRLSIPKQRSPKIDKSTVSIIHFDAIFFAINACLNSNLWYSFEQQLWSATTNEVTQALEFSNVRSKGRTWKQRKTVTDAKEGVQREGVGTAAKLQNTSDPRRERTRKPKAQTISPSIFLDADPLQAEVEAPVQINSQAALHDSRIQGAQVRD